MMIPADHISMGGPCDGHVMSTSGARKPRVPSRAASMVRTPERSSRRETRPPGKLRNGCLCRAEAAALEPQPCCIGASSLCDASDDALLPMCPSCRRVCPNFTEFACVADTSAGHRLTADSTRPSPSIEGEVLAVALRRLSNPVGEVTPRTAGPSTAVGLIIRWTNPKSTTMACEQEIKLLESATLCDATPYCVYCAHMMCKSSAAVWGQVPHLLLFEVVQNIRGFDVSVDVASSMDVLQSDEESAHVLTNVLWRKGTSL